MGAGSGSGVGIRRQGFLSVKRALAYFPGLAKEVQRLKGAFLTKGLKFTSVALPNGGRIPDAQDSRVGAPSSEHLVGLLLRGHHWPVFLD